MSQNITKVINETLDIATVISSFISIHKKGNNYITICPFHGDRNPSLVISPQKRIFKCFSCNESGGIIDFVMKFNKINFVSAINLLNEKFSLNLDLKYYDNNEKNTKYSELEKEIINTNSLATILFKVNLKTEINNNVLLKNFFYERKMTEEIIQKFDIGYASDNEKFKNFLINVKKIPKDILINSSILTESENSFFINRIIFPIKNEFNDIVGFSGRIIQKNDNVPKYLNTPQNNLFSKSKILFNYYEANNNLNEKNEIIICEGFMDVIALYKSGIKNVVALMGTSLSQYHIPLLKNKKVVLWLDGDKAGKLATKKSILILLKNKIKVEIINNTTSLDPDEILNLNGKEVLVQMINQRITAFDFVYKELSFDLIPDNFLSTTSFVKEFLSYLIYASDQEKSFFINKCVSEHKIPSNFFNSINIDNSQKTSDKVVKKKFLKQKNEIFANHLKEMVTSILLIPEIGQKYLRDQELVFLDQKIKKMINEFLKIPDINKRKELLEKNHFFSDNNPKKINDWKSIKKRNNEFYFNNFKVNIFNKIKELENEKANAKSEKEVLEIKQKINSIYNLWINFLLNNRKK
ncbi:DNA primase [Mesomycoplasma neurolyticum]|uniref:DNA primase n=1 Tax=Mesomycoplasma neurolyticum TaxID=2120 RepID=A0A449A4R5_9BACT|nr:DNA primase [Mesomycoplasma neurolyticum]VEU59204.1 DNA primase [Mesomycoplasma neurolyticum]